MLITNAEIYGARHADLRIEKGQIATIGNLAPKPGEQVINALGGALLPGLHDHHMHLMSYAASLQSVSCGPPDVCTESQLVANLRDHADTREASGWIRGFRYHESVAGEIDRRWLDRCLPDVPVRIQHRSGRLWIINTAGNGLAGGGSRRWQGRHPQQRQRAFLRPGHAARQPDGILAPANTGLRANAWPPTASRASPT